MLIIVSLCVKLFGLVSGECKSGSEFNSDIQTEFSVLILIVGCYKLVYVFCMFISFILM